jgi:hypothetical protein
VVGTRDGTAVFGQIGVRGRWTQVSLAFVMLVPPIMRRAGGDLRRRLARADRAVAVAAYSA